MSILEKVQGGKGEKGLHLTGSPLLAERNLPRPEKCLQSRQKRSGNGALQWEPKKESTTSCNTTPLGGRARAAHQQLGREQKEDFTLLNRTLGTNRQRPVIRNKGNLGNCDQQSQHDTYKSKALKGSRQSARDQVILFFIVKGAGDPKDQLGKSSISDLSYRIQI